MRRLRRWVRRNTSPTIVGDSIMTGIAAAVGAFGGFMAAFEWIWR